MHSVPWSAALGLVTGLSLPSSKGHTAAPACSVPCPDAWHPPAPVQGAARVLHRTPLPGLSSPWTHLWVIALVSSGLGASSAPTAHRTGCSWYVALPTSPRCAPHLPPLSPGRWDIQSPRPEPGQQAVYRAVGVVIVLRDVRAEPCDPQHWTCSLRAGGS